MTSMEVWFTNLLGLGCLGAVVLQLIRASF
jgi:hypothetical protein